MQKDYWRNKSIVGYKQPTPSPSEEGSFVAGGDFSSPPGRGAGVGWFMGSENLHEMNANRDLEPLMGGATLCGALIKP